MESSKKTLVLGPAETMSLNRIHDAIEKQRKQAETAKRDPEALEALDKASTTAPISVAEGQAHYARHSRNDLIREIVELNRAIQKAELAAVVGQALERRGQQAKSPPLLHAEAFKLMKYRSEGGTKELLVWNSRDGVTPFVVHLDGMKFQHVVGEDLGPYMDRPNECDLQWETRTVKEMMRAWDRSLTRAKLAGKIDETKYLQLKDDVKVAQSWHVHIGLRNLESGRFTDDF